MMSYKRTVMSKVKIIKQKEIYLLTGIPQISMRFDFFAIAIEKEKK